MTEVCVCLTVVGLCSVRSVFDRTLTSHPEMCWSAESAECLAVCWVITFTDNPPPHSQAIHSWPLCVGSQVRCAGLSPLSPCVGITGPTCWVLAILTPVSLSAGLVSLRACRVLGFSPVCWTPHRISNVCVRFPQAWCRDGTAAADTPT